ncbi:MAG: Asp-tRNA(Asn)/Glu-tRNA(Gln) amidotransferase subunit GatB [Candidatus Tagabacteria bacterium CG09_land_8_20_14_0_10_41_14]|uniref:Aspartyl/glutamyl-tRNA(Asn/Gln) amidotransferase subunit B n=2 Tax=Candidatus Tagaibacteriota TaxID=1817918 RepID=A0A2H0WL06_9BACT|nr:MAG: Asp-tRNA(Asn)/Glu-tRNA(Gln) amidotransferase subunit GatB [Candidatus Tagabacteria bacterium CG09_land_8_20_14_0_10_41_14]PJE72928.1 MAG: Asp-tRNA(Asn)/Glu-tRNA(Gln) amidotransferase subunit GatB [Candidatus Tagabacteria bacterium CG10_big_fil_rev_8_21_14_0_10_40_13]
MNYVPKIGLEIHAELKTKTKMFCDSPNDPDEKHPNVNICPVCMGYPGTLPVINKEAVKSVLRAGLAINGKLADFTQWDRKNYFYPDLPKGYQISQYKYPLVSGGVLNNVKITRIHLEEDTGRLIHDGDVSLVDFNRAGVPLMELVTEPDITSAEQARRFAEELRLLLRYLEISEADMEKGQLRIEVNISLGNSVSKRADFKKSVLGTKVEIKNLNSFKSVEQSINYEIKRQAGVLGKGEKVIQETRGWNENKQKTFSQRSKEEARDYRYFPEPDLPPLKINEIEDFQNLEKTLPELPWQRRERMEKEYKLPREAVNLLVENKKMADFFEEAISESRAETKKKVTGLTLNYLTSDLAGIMREKYLDFDNLLLTAENFADLITMLSEDKISSRAAKDVLKEMVETGAEPHVVVLEHGLEQTSDDDLIMTAAQKVVEENPRAAEDYKKGKESALQFLVGMMMKETKGAANPQKAVEILQKLLEN